MGVAPKTTRVYPWVGFQPTVRTSLYTQSDLHCVDVCCFIIGYLHALPVIVPVTRPRSETTDERRERKKALKEERKVCQYTTCPTRDYFFPSVSSL